MKTNFKEVEINGELYDLKSSIKETKQVANTTGLPLVMIRTRSTGVHYGYMKSKNGQEVELLNARRVWYWDGAASLSQLAQEGTSKPQNCKFPCEVDSITLFEVIEIIPITDVAYATLNKVKIWKQ